MWRRAPHNPGLNRINSFPNNLDQYPLPAPPIKLAVEYLLPRAEIQAPIRDRHHDLAAHDLSLHMRIGIIFAGAVVTVFADWFVRGQFFQPVVVILVQAALNIVDQKNTTTAACPLYSLPIGLGCAFPE